MQNYGLITGEIVFVVVLPLLALYLKGNWPLRKIILPLVIIPVLWYFTYAPLHELSHAAGLYWVGGKATAYHLIPRFWMGEFGRAWITTSGISHAWQQLTMTAFPYVLDVLCFVVALFGFGRGFHRDPFMVGLTFMLLCLRPAFDFVCEPAAFLFGDRGDFYAIQQVAGPLATWALILICTGLAGYTVITTLRRLVPFQNTR